MAERKVVPTLIRPTSSESRNGEVGTKVVRVDAKEEGEKKSKEIMPVEDEEESVKVKALRQPYQPTAEEIAEHELTHIPFRDWCIHCMKGRGQSNQHRSQDSKDKEKEQKEGATTTFSMDYMFLTVENEVITKEEAEKIEVGKISFPILVGKDRLSGAIVAHKVEAKGRGNGYIVKRIIADLEELGYGGTKILLKNDQENAITDV